MVRGRTREGGREKVREGGTMGENKREGGKRIGKMMLLIVNT